jgi:hypothetical protein
MLTSAFKYATAKEEGEGRHNSKARKTISSSCHLGWQGDFIATQKYQS